MYETYLKARLPEPLQGYHRLKDDWGAHQGPSPPTTTRRRAAALSIGGTDMLKEALGLGLMTEAVDAIPPLGFEELGPEPASEARADRLGERGVEQVLEATAFTIEGRLERQPVTGQDPRRVVLRAARG